MEREGEKECGHTDRCKKLLIGIERMSEREKER